MQEKRLPACCDTAVLSKPLHKGFCGGIADCIRVRIRKTADGRFFAEFFTRTQVFHRTLEAEEFRVFTEKLPYAGGLLWRQCFITNANQEFNLLTNKKGKSTLLCKERVCTECASAGVLPPGQNRRKDYIIGEDSPVPFLTAAGIMNKDGKVFASKYAKFRQINRFLEYVDDVLPELTADGGGTQYPLNIIDFGCGKSYLTFALYHFFTAVKGLQAEITGLDIKTDVIEYCRTAAQSLQYTGLHFEVRDVREYAAEKGRSVDMVISLHACDTATDYALSFALKHRARVILSVPCCQHELNSKLNKNGVTPAFKALMHYGIIKERFAAPATDVMRAELIKKHGYCTDICEFIDTEHTPKNLLIRAVRRTNGKTGTACRKNDASFDALCNALGARITLEKLSVPQEKAEKQTPELPSENP